MIGFAEKARISKFEEARQMGIDDALIAALIDQFYDRVQAHPVLGPIFARRVTEWPSHLHRMKDFWASIAIESGRFHGNPMLKHVAIAEIQQEHFDEWLSLWAATIGDVVTNNKAADFLNNRAIRIAESLSIAISLHRDRTEQGRLP